MFSNPPSPENRAVYEIIWKNVVDPARPQMTVWRMRIACTHTHTHTQVAKYSLHFHCTMAAQTHLNVTL
jgi:hypothetical protein